MPAGALLALILFLSSCDTTKWVPQGHYLLVKNTLHNEAKELTEQELNVLLKQKPNKRVLGMPLYLYLYNLRDPAKVARKRELKDSLCLVRNEQRARDSLKLKTCDHTLRGRNGEAPVVLDSGLTARSVEQLERYLEKEGYYGAVVTDTVLLSRREHTSHGQVTYDHPKAEVLYRIRAGRPYTLCSWTWTVNDTTMDRLMREAQGATLLQVGMRFDADVLDKERTRVSDLFRQQGYLFFNRDLVVFDADTSAGDHQVDVVMRLERPMAHGDRGLKGTAQGRVYRLAEVLVDTRSKRGTPANTDTAEWANKQFLYIAPQPIYKPKVLSNQVTLKPGDKFSQTATDRNYRRLTGLRVFDRVDITYDTSGTRANDLANCRVTLLPSKRQNFSTEGFLTNRGGFLGTSVGFNYRHKNLFRRLGFLQAQMTLGLEAQQSLGAQSGGTDDASTAVGRDVLFNTVELGPEVTLRFPRFQIPFVNVDKWTRTWSQRTTINALYNYQRRPDYTRTLAKVSYGYEWNKRRSRTWGFYPAEINVIRIPQLSTGFQQFIAEANDAVLRDSYTNHVIAGAKLTYTWNTQDPTVRKRDVYLWRVVVQSSGNLLSALNDVTGQPLETDTAGNNFYTFAGVRFAQFIKGESDIRWYHTIHEKSSMAFRLAAGVGVPFGNLGVLPFETSFFSGGANSIRAWRARALGPGSYSAPLDAYDRIGEIRIEGNVEYRFKLIGYLEGALFCDMGNIWDLKEQTARPGGKFEANDFLSEVAFGTGIGARLNFDFFLVRFDLGLQTKDPGLPVGQRWIFQQRDEVRPLGQLLNLNLGIGYPF